MMHATERALERYGIQLDKAGLRAIEAQLVKGEGMVLSRDTGGLEEVRVIRVCEQLVTVACIVASGAIKTFLPPPLKRTNRESNRLYAAIRRRKSA